MLNETRRTQNDGKMRTRTGGTRGLLPAHDAACGVLYYGRPVATYRLDYLSMTMRKRVEQIRMTAARALPCGVCRVGRAVPNVSAMVKFRRSKPSAHACVTPNNHSRGHGTEPQFRYRLQHYLDLAHQRHTENSGYRLNVIFPPQGELNQRAVSSLRAGLSIVRLCRKIRERGKE